MPPETLITVQESFFLQGKGVVIIPSLADATGRFKPFSECVTIRYPDGSERQFEAKFSVWHFTLIGGGSRWCIGGLLPGAAKHAVPEGSTLVVSQEALQHFAKAHA